MSINLPDRSVEAGSLRRQVEEAPDPKGFRVEIIRGKVVMSPTPSFKHGGIVRRIEQQLLAQLDEGRIAQQMYSIASPIDADDYCSPDLVVVPAEVEDEDGWLLDADAVDLTVEVASPGNASCDLTDKLGEYAAWQIPVYLLADPRKGDILVHSDPLDGKYRTTHEARFGDVVDLPAPLQGLRVDTSGFRRYS
ncbi:Uma2 family endonuclease [Lipingzhangella halophila]|uniref:Uma2 family endonuclease n=1 Tax=Lipingzhangella halophila TaxID=1783352 RepID=A0A7W7W007_9ACTN|nr:Uma2 family endonuclease [Lipingzhangella halophila]MBB4929412.1 Uma2 family endonuclease [Lipingzhangella halophila]